MNADTQQIVTFASGRGIEMTEEDAKLFLWVRKLKGDKSQTEAVRRQASDVLACFTEWFAQGGDRRQTFSELFIPDVPETPEEQAQREKEEAEYLDYFLKQCEPFLTKRGGQ